MSRSNTNYYNLCHRWGEIGEDGYCDFHRGYAHQRCIPPGKYLCRRGFVVRKPRFPVGSAKSWHNGPPASMKRIWSKQIRARYQAELARRPDEPELFSYNRTYSDFLWMWY